MINQLERMHGWMAGWMLERVAARAQERLNVKSQELGKLIHSNVTN